MKENITSNQNLRKNRLKRKKNANKKLLFIFFSTFVGVLLLLTHLASVYSPSIDIPVLDNANESTSLTSKDFKARVDSRLKLIELRDKNPEDEKKESVKVESNSDQIIENKQEDKFMEEHNRKFNEMMAEKEDTSIEDQNTLANNSNQIIPPVDFKNEQTMAPPMPVIPPTPMPNNIDNKRNIAQPYPTLRKKIVAKSPNKFQMVKVLVGSYSNPTDARQASSEITRVHANLTPFIREVNGRYTLQVGSFTNPQKAQELVKILSNGSNTIRIIKE